MMRAKVEGALLLDESAGGWSLIFLRCSRRPHLCGGLRAWLTMQRPTRSWTPGPSRRRDSLPAVSINWGTWEEMRIAGGRGQAAFSAGGTKADPGQSCASDIGASS